MSLRAEPVLLVLLVVGLGLLDAACGDDRPGSARDVDASEGDAGDPDAAMIPTFDPLRGFARVVPGHASEAHCRAANPDPAHRCVELFSMCLDGTASLQLTDVIHRGDATRDGDVFAVRWLDPDPAFAVDETTHFTLVGDGVVEGAEVYGDRAFEQLEGALVLCQDD
jgi:hypothetical protein